EPWPGPGLGPERPGRDPRGGQEAAPQGRQPRPRLPRPEATPRPAAAVPRAPPQAGRQESLERAMTTETAVTRQWGRLLRPMLVDHRKAHPDDPRTDHELVICFMETFVAYGAIEKRNGKYVIGELT